ncbi:MAG: hypothetical protein ACO25F_12560, partial [Erythrobacter sp.]
AGGKSSGQRMAILAHTVERSPCLTGIVNFFNLMTEKNVIQINSCRLHTMLVRLIRLIRDRDPKGSEQRCEEFLNF